MLILNIERSSGQSYKVSSVPSTWHSYGGSSSDWAYFSKKVFKKSSFACRDQGGISQKYISTFLRFYIFTFLHFYINVIV